MTPLRAARLFALLDRDGAPEEGAALSPFSLWAMFVPPIRHDETGRDGHMAGTVLNLPTGMDRRMWAKSELAVEKPLLVGEAARRVTTVAGIDWKEGRSGRLCFVRLEHRIEGEAGARLAEDQTIVYRGAALPPPPPTEPEPLGFEPDWRRPVAPDPVLLFQYSAVTSNTHRIHYDHPYATGVEGYPGLVVHGPLIATTLIDALERETGSRPVARCTVMARRPIFLPETYAVTGLSLPDGSFKLAAVNGDGAICMTIEGVFVA